MNFSDLQIENKLKKSIELAEFKDPTPIQKESIAILNLDKIQSFINKKTTRSRRASIYRYDF